jgi:hypothetical protein
MNNFNHNIFAIYVIFISVIAIIFACVKDCINNRNHINRINNNIDNNNDDNNEIPPQYNSKSSLPSYNAINI